MTWQSFFNITTMGHRHLLFVYARVLVIQGSYFGWIPRNWSLTKIRRH